MNFLRLEGLDPPAGWLNGAPHNFPTWGAVQKQLETFPVTMRFDDEYAIQCRLM